MCIRDREQAGDYAKLLDEGFWAGLPACTRVVHMWALDTGISDPSAADVAAATKVGTHSALLLSQALAKWSTSPKLVFATRGTQDTGNEAAGLSVAQAPLWPGEGNELRQLAVEMAIACRAAFFVAIGDGLPHGHQSMPSLLMLQMRLHAEGAPLGSNAFSFAPSWRDDLGL